MAKKRRRRDVAIMRFVQSLQPDVFVNVIGIAMIKLPLVPCNVATSLYPLRDPRVRAELAAAIHQSRSKLIPFDHEINRVLNVVEGWAWKQPRTDLALAEAIEQEPLIEALYILLVRLSPPREIRETATSLMASLNNVGKMRGVDVKSPAWPKGPAHLSQRISTLSPLLAKCGIEVSRGRQKGERFIRARLIEVPGRHVDDDDDGSASPSTPVSSPNVVESKELSPKDDDDDALRHLLNRISAPEKGEATE